MLVPQDGFGVKRAMVATRVIIMSATLSKIVAIALLVLGMMLLLVIGSVFFSSVIKVSLNGHVFFVPKSYSLESFAQKFVGLIGGSEGDAMEFMFIVSGDELARNIDGYIMRDGDYRGDIVAVLSVLSSEEVMRYNDSSRYSDVWFGTGSYRSMVVESYGASGLWKIYRKVEFPYSWTVLSKLRVDEGMLPAKVFDFWVAQCLLSSSSLTPSGKHVDCNSYVLENDLAIEFRVSEQNIGKMDQIRKFLMAKVIEWEK